MRLVWIFLVLPLLATALIVAGWHYWDFLQVGWNILLANKEHLELLALLGGGITGTIAVLSFVSKKSKPQASKSHTESPAGQSQDNLPEEPRSLPPHYRQLLQAVRDSAQTDNTLLRAVYTDPPRTLEEYRLHCVARHAQGAARVDLRFVRLSLLLDRRWDKAGEVGWEEKQEERRLEDLRDVLEELPDDRALVLLGAPGCGKSTLLRRLEYDLAVAALQTEGETAALTWEVPLNAYEAGDQERLPAPQEWLADRWEREYPHLPKLSELPQKGLCLLLDGLNEISHQTPEEYDARVSLWREWLQKLPAGIRVLFSCRSLNYGERLSSETLTVPHVRFRELDDGQVQAFLQAYLQQQWEPLWDDLRRSPRLQQERTPFYLKMEVEQYQERGRPPNGPAELFSGFLWQALRRELVAKRNPDLLQGRLLSQRDRERIRSAEPWWKAPHRLPEEGNLLPGLTRLAYALQRASGGAANPPVGYDRALQLIEAEDAARVVAAGEALRLLDERRRRNELFFAHSLLKEYLAARQLAKTPDYSLLHLPWRVGEVQPPLSQAMIVAPEKKESLKIPVNEWQETARLAAALAEAPEPFIEGMMPVNLPLAGLCAAQPGVKLADEKRRVLAEKLAARSSDPQADLRARVAAGLALGELGDPRLERYQGPHGVYLLAPRVGIPAGSYRLGSDPGEGNENEFQSYEIPLEAFELARFPVTNAEWRCFMDADGYTNPAWWEGTDAQAWRWGKLSLEPEKQSLRDFRQRLRKDFAGTTAGFSPAAVEQYQTWVDADDGAFEQALSSWYPEGAVMDQPAFWHDPDFNNPAQPVAGICWYEARAYCRWLSAQTGERFSLPAEAQWEAACRGFERREFAWGDGYDAHKANLYDTHLRRTTPVGIFPHGDTPEGLAEMTGNVWEWTSDRYQAYPIRPGDGRDSASGRDPRVLRGGSFLDVRHLARAAFRYPLAPANRLGDFGFRVCCVRSPHPER